MKNPVWALFLTGMVSTGIVASVWLKETRASQPEDPRAQTLPTDPKASGLKTPVPDEGQMEKSLAGREKELAEREAKLKEWQERLAVEESRLKDRVADLEKLQSDVQQVQEKNKVQADVVLKRLVKTLETMQPNKAAAVMAQLQDDLAVELFMTMKEKKVAAIFDVMEASRATQLSSLVAKRRPAGKAVGEEQARQ